MNLTEKLSTHFRKALPRWVEADYQTFVDFLEAYYEWMSESGQGYEVLANMRNYRDIDRTIEDYISHFKTKYLYGLPIDMLADPRLFTKHVKDYYRAKGTEKSIKLLFRILYNDSVTFYYPGDDLLRVSDGRWQVDKAIKTTSTDPNHTLLINRKITGLTSGATAVVDNVIRQQIDDTLVTEWFLSQINGTFVVGESIRGTDRTGRTTVTETIYPVFTTVTITNPGTTYMKGDQFSVVKSDTNATVMATGTVISVDGKATGPILRVRLDNFGVANFVGAAVDLSEAGDGNATATVASGPLATYPGVYLDTRGQVSNDKILQDSLYWQDFSYVLRSPVLFETYEDIIKGTVHPAGMILFGETIANVGEVVEVSAAMNDMTTYQELILTMIEAVHDVIVSLAANPTYLVTTSTHEQLLYETIGDLPMARIASFSFDQLGSFAPTDPIPEILNPPIPYPNQPGISFVTATSSIEP